jgi:uncharacterized membrane protein
MEIGNYFALVAAARGTSLSSTQNDVYLFNGVAQIDYTLLFITVLGLLNSRRVRSILLSLAVVVCALIALFVVSTFGLYLVYGLRVSYVDGTALGLFGIPWANVAARFVTYAFTAGIFAVLFEYSRSDLLDNLVSKEVRRFAFDAIAYPVTLLVASCELMNIAAQLHISDADRYGLSILWGVFSLAVIVIGIARAKKHLRVGAMALIALTLAKLFFYDITDLGTIAKTLLFIALGLLLLVISFLYNKYKTLIFGIETDQEVGS